ncbi:MAG: hypothetical protein QUS14_14685, partial [Pyrinomonadaceae bacterium]|nr:hypothetical protein [Pyrinomonadaceae bacterium]
MKIVHSIGKHWEKDQVESLASLGFEVEEDVFSYISVEPEQFELIKEVVMRPNRIYSVGAVFDKADLNGAEWLALTALGGTAYPQPELSWEVGMVYDVSDRCKKCGLNRGRQRHPFRIRSDKTRLQAFQLEWVYDEIFVQRPLYDEMFAPLGIGYWPVLIYRTGKESENVVQLDLPECDWSFDMTGLRTEDCTECGQRKCVVRPMDFLPPLNGEPPNQIFRGQEFFGSGAQAVKRIYLSQEIRQELLTREITRWHQYYP